MNQTKQPSGLNKLISIPLLLSFALLTINAWGQPVRKAPARIRYLDGIYMGIPEAMRKLHIEDSLARKFGKAKALDILKKCEINAWPSLAKGVIIDLDTVPMVKYFTGLNTWRIFLFHNNISILEVRPEDNPATGDPSFKESFYILHEGSEYLDFTDWAKTAPVKDKAPAKEKEPVLAEKQKESKPADNTARYAAEYQENRAIITRVQNKLDLFIREAEWILDYTNSYAESNKWGWEEYIKYFNKMKKVYTGVLDAYNSNLKNSMSVGNPDRSRIENWHSLWKEQDALIQKEFISLDNLIKQSKTPSLYSFRTSYQNVIRYARKVYEKPY